jgi:HSP20 family molecular chaperone IbpA
MTNIIAPLVRRSRQLPALFNENWLSDALSQFDKWEKAWDLTNVHYPYDVSYTLDDNNEIVSYQLDIALAGVGKENIKLNVKDQCLILDIDRKDRVEDKNTVWAKTGISYRQSRLQYSLGKNVDVKRIKSTYKDGMLSVYIPLTKAKVTDIEISVE